MKLLPLPPIGAKVHHRIFGEGEVTENGHRVGRIANTDKYFDNSRVVIQFTTCGEREFLWMFAQGNIEILP